MCFEVNVLLYIEEQSRSMEVDGLVLLSMSDTLIASYRFQLDLPGLLHTVGEVRPSRYDNTDQ